MDRLETQLLALPAFDRPVKALVRVLASRATDAKLDVQGRILLPVPLRTEVGLERDALVIGVLDRFEVWAPDAWDGFVRESERFLDDASLGVAWPLPGRSRSGPSSTGQPKYHQHFRLDTPLGTHTLPVEICGKKWCQRYGCAELQTGFPPNASPRG